MWDETSFLELFWR